MIKRDCITLRFRMICDDCKTRLDSIGEESREDCHKRAQREGWYYYCEIGREFARCPQCIQRLADWVADLGKDRGMTWQHIGTAFRNKRGQIVALHPEGEYKARICVESCGEPVPSASCSKAYPRDKAEAILRKRAERYGWDEVIA